MIGVVIGIVFSVVIFTLNPKDSKAVSQFKKKKQQEQEKKKKQAKQQKQAIQKMQNDPVLKKKRQQNQTAMRQKLLQGLKDDDKKMLLDYLDQKKKSGKSQAQIIKEATGKVGAFMTLTMLMVIVIVIAIIFLTTEGNPNSNSTRFFTQLAKVIKQIYPRFGDTATGGASGAAGSSSQF